MMRLSLPLPREISNAARLMRIVLCDDHTLFTEALASQLESRGHEVVATVQSPAALGLPS